MKLHALTLVLASLLAVAGCEKSSNVTAMQDEVAGVTNHYKQRFDDLSRRVGALEQRGRTMTSIGTPQGLEDVRKLFLDTNRKLAELKSAVNAVPASTDKATKGENPRVELIRLMGEIKHRFEKAEIEINANIDQVEQWLAYIEYRPKVAAAPAPTTPPMDEPKREELPEDPNAPKADTPKADAPKTDAPKTDAPKTDAPKTDAPKTDAPKTDAPKKDAPKAPAGSGSGR